MDADLSHDPAVLADLLAERRAAAPTSSSAPATCRAARSPTGRGTGGRSPGPATSTPGSCSASPSATPPPATGPTTADGPASGSTSTAVRADGYGFQVEMAYRIERAGGLMVEVPIEFRDRTLGQSKMSCRIVVEALVLVTWWGLSGRRRARRKRRAPTRA